MPATPKNCSKGFTMIELLLVMAVIAIIAGGIITTLNPDKFFKPGRDAKRKNDLKQLQNSLNSYFLDKTAYPDAGCDGDADPNTAFCCSSWGNANWIANLTPTYLKQLPHDPAEPASPGPPDICYANGITLKSGYKIQFRLEEQNNSIGDYVGTEVVGGKTYYRYDLKENWSFN